MGAERTMVDLLACGGGVGVGAMAAGLTPALAVEMEPKYAACHERNVPGRVVVARVEDVDYSQVARPWWLHMSPVCKNASSANAGAEVDDYTGTKETREDMQVAEALAGAIRALSAPRVSLENVYFYRTFESFRIICRALTECGYAFNFWHLNSADYGVPQTRRRLILVASLDSDPRMPHPTHADPELLQEGGMFGETLLPWRGWYQAVEDLLPGLPDAGLAPWHRARLPEEWKALLGESVLVGGGNTNIAAPCGAPRRGSAPAFTVSGSSDRERALLVTNEESHNARGEGYGVAPGGRDTEPAMTVKTNGASQMRAFLIDGSSGSPIDGAPTVRDGDEPGPTIPANGAKAQHRAALLHPARRVRVVKLSARCYARLQSLPDWYVLPEGGERWAIVGNMVPPLLFQRIVEANP